MGKPRMLAKDGSSGEQGCPSAYVDGDEMIVQGPASPLSELENVLPGETASRIKMSVIREALARYDSGQ